MFDLGWSELLLIGVVALIVVGPKDLPVLFRNVGKFMGRAKGMAREFSKAMNDAADETGVKDVAKTFKTAANPMSSAMDGVRDAAKSMTNLNLDPKSETGKLAKEREADRKKIEVSTARAAADRKKREAESAAKRADEMEAEMKAEAQIGPDADAPKGDA
ncbi:Sec-independent protein translocase protein TatB [Puniceibacterium sediminis]|uniref:Sec-independent protein translocase protein TatB n=1 Tax=Puniceibacterium sediminis TaxID=1608407 RepID=A0A238XIE1_9RHOB|nr:Sec-independent protein translocase protein TatB [Puniceibacterium sediminis]SNR58243.1 sec-independent protein translocase protein TatB [Puniceibacterium sediminis]